MEQRSEEWFHARLGKVTASRIADVMAKTKSGPAATRRNYMAELIAERLTQQPAKSFSSAAMQWGTDTEPQARAAYEFQFDATVTETGFVPHKYLESGASPDGLVGDDGLVEIKCPNTATHLDYFEAGELTERKYLLQMQWQMACTDRKWCDFVSFDPRLPAWCQVFLVRIERDDDLIREIEAEVKAFLAEIARKIDALHDRAGLSGVAA